MEHTPRRMDMYMSAPPSPAVPAIPDDLEGVLSAMTHVETVEKQNSTTNKGVAERKKALKQKIGTILQEQGMKFVPHGDKFWVDEEKVSRAPLTDKFLKKFYLGFAGCKRGHYATIDQEADDYVHLLRSVQARLGKKQRSCNKKKSLPSDELVLDEQLFH